jgi:hypothetical protein
MLGGNVFALYPLNFFRFELEAKKSMLEYLDIEHLALIVPSTYPGVEVASYIQRVAYLDKSYFNPSITRVTHYPARFACIHKGVLFFQNGSKLSLLPSPPDNALVRAVYSIIVGFIVVTIQGNVYGLLPNDDDTWRYRSYRIISSKNIVAVGPNSEGTRYQFYTTEGNVRHTEHW